MKKRYKNRYGLFAAIMMVVTSSFAQDVSVNVAIDQDSIIIGDQIGLTLEVDHNIDYYICFPIHQDTLTKSVEIVEIFPIDTVKVDAEWLIEKQLYIITSFDSGTYVIPPFTITIDKGSRMDTLHTVPLKLYVNTMPVDMEQPIKDIKNIYGFPITFKDLLPYILITLGAGLLAYIIVYVAKRIKRKEPILRILEKPKIPPEIIAYRELDNLKKEKLWQQGKVKEYYSRLTEIIRIYIEGRYLIMAMEQTSDEILLQFRQLELENSIEYDMLNELLNLADMVKFAKGQPLPDENNKHLNNAYKFVEITTPKPTDEEEDESLDQQIDILTEEN